MKLGTLVLVCLAALFVSPFTSAADEPKREPKPRFKGVWQFAIMDGTNRNKAENEVKTAPTVYAGADKFTAALKLLAENEMVFWTHQIKGFEFPPKDDLKKIDEAAKAAKVRLERAEK